MTRHRRLSDGARNRRRTIGAALRDEPVFPAMVAQMVTVGETTGALDAMLSKIADFYEEEVDTAVAGLLTLLEPLMKQLLLGKAESVRNLWEKNRWHAIHLRDAL